MFISSSTSVLITIIHTNIFPQTNTPKSSISKRTHQTNFVHPFCPSLAHTPQIIPKSQKPNRYYPSQHHQPQSNISIPSHHHLPFLNEPPSSIAQTKAHDSGNGGHQTVDHVGIRTNRSGQNLRGVLCVVRKWVAWKGED